MIRRHVGAASGSQVPLCRVAAALLTSAPPKYIAFRWLDTVIVLGSLALLFFGDPNIEIEIKVAAERRRPRESPAHPMFVRLQFRKRRARHRPEHHVMVGQVNGGAIEGVSNHR